MKLHLLDLPWLDILCSYILPYLSVKDWFNLRVVSKSTLVLTRQFFEVMKVLDLTDQQIPRSVFKIFSSETQQLQRLCLRGANITNAELQNIFRNNVNLVDVDLSRCQFLTNGCLQPMAVNCKKLERISLAHSKWLSVGALETMSFHNTITLTSVDLTACTSVNEDSLILFIARHPRLKELSIACLSFVKDRTLNCISRSCANLERLNLEGCSGITDDGLQYIIEYCLHLQCLNVNRCLKISERSLLRLRQRGTVQILSLSPVIPRSNHYPPWRWPWLPD